MSIIKFIDEHVMVWIVNRLYGIDSHYDESNLLPGLKHLDTVTLKDGSIFKVTPNLPSVLHEVINEYDISDIRASIKSNLFNPREEG